MKQAIYLDNAAATPVEERVFNAMKPYFADKFYNPSALYLHAKDVKNDLRTARQKVAKAMGGKESEIVFTAGGTEANNLAIHGVMKANPDNRVIVSNIEHESVISAVEQYNNSKIFVDNKGRVDTEKLSSMITDDTVLVSIMYANNEIGTIQPISEIAATIATHKKQRIKKGIKTPLYFHADAAQAANYLPLFTHKLGVDLMTINGGKIYGPKQSGALFVRAGIQLVAQIEGGGQERGLRSGTENVPAIIGLSEAVDIAEKLRSKEVKRLQELQNQFINQLKDKLPKVTINGSLKHRLPNNVHITIPGTDNERLMMELDEKGIMCATGSACSASNDEPSYVLSAIGLSDEDARSSLRFTMGRKTTKQDINMVVKTLSELCL